MGHVDPVPADLRPAAAPPPGLIRAVPHVVALLGGVRRCGFGIGAAGALLTGVVKDRLADRAAGTVTGMYVVAMLVGATVVSGLARTARRGGGRMAVLARRLGGAHTVIAVAR